MTHNQTNVYILNFKVSNHSHHRLPFQAFQKKELQIHKSDILEATCLYLNY